MPIAVDWTRAALSTLAMLLVLSGCGSSSPTSPESNNAKIQQAQQGESSARELHAKLETTLGLHHYAGVNNVFTLPDSGKPCDIDGIYVGREAQVYADESNALTSPDGAAVVEVGRFEGTPMSDCMSAVQRALGW